jgi:hypothetical protein
VTILKRISILLALCACLATAGCGSDDEPKGDPIPAQQAAELQNRLDETEARLANGSVGACKDILDDTMPEVTRILSGLPGSIDADVRDALEESFDNLWSLVESECQGLKPDEPVQTETDTTPETTTTETAPETTETTPPPTDTTTAPEEAPLPNDGDGENGGSIPETGNGGGVGPGAAKEKTEKLK